MRPGTISEDYIMIILRELLRGLDYLHNDQKLHRDVKGMLAYASEPVLQNTDNISCKHSFNSQWSGEVGRFWGFWTALSNDDEEKHVCWHSVLDGSRSHQAVWL